MADSQDLVPVKLSQTEVSVSNLANEVIRIHREAAAISSSHLSSDSSNETVAAKVKVTLSNVIFLLLDRKENATKKQVDVIIEELLSEHPSRFFILNYSPRNEANSDIKAFVSSRCQLTKSGTKVCSEEIYISATQEAVKYVPNLLLSHLIPDIQAAFIVLSDPCDKSLVSAPANHKLYFKTLLSGVERFSDRVIFDSAIFDSYEQSVSAIFDFSKMISQVGEHAGGSLGHSGVGGSEAQIRDLSWRRIRRFRVLISEYFDAFEDVDVTNLIRSVEFDYTKGSWTGHGDLLLLCAWFLKCLGWKVVDAEQSSNTKKVISCMNKRGENCSITLSIKEVLESEVKGIERVGIVYQRSGEACKFELLRDSASTAKLTESLLPDCKIKHERKVPFYIPKQSQLILAEMLSTQVDPAYESALGRSLKLAKLLFG